MTVEAASLPLSRSAINHGPVAPRWELLVKVSETVAAQRVRAGDRDVAAIS
jgi:hypothetical protein